MSSTFPFLSSSTQPAPHSRPPPCYCGCTWVMYICINVLWLIASCPLPSDTLSNEICYSVSCIYSHHKSQIDLFKTNQIMPFSFTTLQYCLISFKVKSKSFKGQMPYTISPFFVHFCCITLFLHLVLNFQLCLHLFLESNFPGGTCYFVLKVFYGYPAVSYNGLKR